MLRDLGDMPDEARIYIFVASRPLTPDEAREIVALFDAWLTLWSAANRCAASLTTSKWNGQVLYFAMDERPREARGIEGGLTGSDLDWLYRPLWTLESHVAPRVEVTPGLAVFVDGKLVPWGPAWRELYMNRQFNEDMQIITPCAVADWRAGRLVHRLGDDPQAAALIPPAKR